MASPCVFDGRRLLRTYTFTWSLLQLIPFLNRVLVGPGQGAIDARPISAEDIWLLPLLFANACWPSLGLLTAAHMLNIALRARRMPFVWDHECWATLTEISFVLRYAASKWGSGEGGEGLDLWMRGFFRQVRVQVVILYFSAANWKLTTSFLNPNTSCATVLVSELVAAYAPEAIMPVGGQLARFIVMTGPAVTVLAEFAIPVLLLLGGRARALGLAFGLFFHMVILMLPINAAGGFSTACAAAYVAFCSESAAQVLAEMLQGRTPRAYFAASVVACAALAGLRLKCAGLAPDAALLIYILFLALYALAALQTWAKSCVNSAEVATPLARSSCRDRALLTTVAVLTFSYGFLGPVLGVQNMGASTMYANVKHDGGSNHLLLPTGLLQAKFAPGVAGPAVAGSAADAFGGGLVRVECTTSETFRRFVPANIAIEFQARATALMKAVGHSGIQFAVYYERMASPLQTMPGTDAVGGSGGNASGICAQPPEPGVPYVLPAFELRRLLAVARRRGEAFALNYTRLPWKARSPSAWLRAPGGGKESIFVQEPGGRCRTVLGEPCETGELALLPAPPFWLSKILLPYPLALLPGDGEDVHCAA